MQCSKLDAGQPVVGVADYFWPVRGKTILNSVKSPDSVSTSMLPPCCFTMMSWLIDRPSPVPSPVGLVVKNGLNILSLTFSGMPVPLSRIRISTLSPRFFVMIPESIRKIWEAAYADCSPIVYEPGYRSFSRDCRLDGRQPSRSSVCTGAAQWYGGSAPGANRRKWRRRIRLRSGDPDRQMGRYL